MFILYIGDSRTTNKSMQLKKIILKISCKNVHANTMIAYMCVLLLIVVMFYCKKKCYFYDLIV